jgi:hypothetical protein
LFECWLSTACSQAILGAKILNPDPAPSPVSTRNHKPSLFTVACPKKTGGYRQTARRVSFVADVVPRRRGLSWEASAEVGGGEIGEAGRSQTPLLPGGPCQGPWWARALLALRIIPTLRGGRG